METRFLEPTEVLSSIRRPVRKLQAVERDEIEVWPYVETIDDLRGYSIDGKDVECVFRGADDLYDHVLIPTNTWNAYLVVIVDRASNAILGHHVLNRNDLYDLRVLADQR
jgi:hypothetical protein